MASWSRQQSIFKWQPLNQSKNEFRLLWLCHGLDECELKHHSLTNPPEYVALSYHWGTTPPDKLLRIDETAVQVTKTLYDAIWALKCQGLRAVWVDALCIDQNSLEERGAQVLRMTAIFQRAHQVIAWLGEAHDGTENVVDSIRAYSRDRQKFLKQPLSSYDISAFSARNYWSRIWIVQEVVVAGRITIMCGSHACDESELLKWQKDDPSNYGQMARVYELQKFRTDRRGQTPVSLLELLALTQRGHFTSTDPLDMVYALLGLVYDRYTYVVEPNYTLSPGRLCYQMVENAIVTTGSLDIILISKFPRHSPVKDLGFHHGGSLPSWCPNFINLPILNDFVVDSIYDRRKRFYAGIKRSRWAATGDELLQRGKFEIKRKTLKVAGKSLGSILTMAIAGSRIPSWNRHLKSYDTELGMGYALLALNKMLLVYSPEYDSQVEFLDLVPEIADRAAANENEQRNSNDVCIWFARNKSWELFGTTLDSIGKDRTGFGEGEGFDTSLAGCKTRRDATSDCLDILTRQEQRVMAFLDEGRLCWVPKTAEQGDMVTLLRGCTVPVVLRRAPGPIPDTLPEDLYYVVGPAIVDARMDGHIWDQWQQEDVFLKDFYLV